MASVFIQLPATGSGTVTSVGLAAPNIFTVSGSPITTTGTITLGLATEVANTVFAGPATGADAAPTFRALVAADIPNLSVYLKADGSVPLSSNWAAGAFQISANSVLVGSAAHQISGLRIVASDTTLSLQTNGSTNAITIDASQLATFVVGLKLPTTGGTATTLSYYEEGTFTANFNVGAGASGSGTSFTVSFVRVGKTVTLQFPDTTTMVIGTSGQAFFATASGTVPARLVPSASNTYFVCASKAQGVAAAGIMLIASTGVITLAPNFTTTWPNATNNGGMFPVAITYTIQ